MRGVLLKAPPSTLPPAGAAVDWSHPLARGLLLDFDFGLHAAYDRVGRRAWPRVGGTAPYSANGAQGLSFTSSYLSLGTGLSSKFAGLTAMTILLRGYWLSTSANNADIVRNDGITNIQFNTGGNIQWSLWRSGVATQATFTGPSTTLPVPHDFVFVWNQAQPILYTDGAATTSTGGPWTGALPSTSATLGFGGNLSGGEQEQGALYRCTIWKRALSRAEVLALRQDPYQFLIAPAPTQRYWFSVGAVAAPVWIPTFVSPRSTFF